MCARFYLLRQQSNLVSNLCSINRRHDESERGGRRRRKSKHSAELTLLVIIQVEI